MATSNIISVKVNVPAASVILLNTMPFPLVPAPAPGFALEPLFAFLRCATFGTTPYTTNTSLFIFNTGGQEIIPAYLHGGGILNFVAATTREFGVRPTTATWTAGLTDNLESSTALVLKAQIGNPGPLTADSDIDIYLTYRLVNLTTGA